MHRGEMWQDYSLAGVPLEDDGYDSSLGNPNSDFKMLVGAASVWFYRRTDSGNIEVLFQLRSKKINNGGKWDVSAAGHMNYNETISEAAIREAKEEIGAEITEDDLKYTFSLVGVKKNLLNHYFLCDWTGREDTFHFDDGEVAEVKWVPLSDFDRFIDENAKDPVKNATFARELSKVWLEEMSGNPQSKE